MKHNKEHPLWFVRCEADMKSSYQCRPDRKCGTVMTFVQDNLILELYEN